MKAIKKFWKFLKLQVRREFFGTIGFITSTAILTYGVLNQNSKIQASQLSAGFPTSIFSVKIWILGLFLVLIFSLYFILRRRKR